MLPAGMGADVGGIMRKVVMLVSQAWQCLVGQPTGVELQCE